MMSGQRASAEARRVYKTLHESIVSIVYPVTLYHSIRKTEMTALSFKPSVSFIITGNLLLAVRLSLSAVSDRH